MADRNQLLALALSGVGDIVRAGISPQQQPTLQPAVQQQINLQEEVARQQQENQNKLQQLMGLELFKKQLEPTGEEKIKQLFQEEEAKARGAAQGKASVTGSAIDLTADQQNQITNIRSQFANIQEIEQDLQSAAQGPFSGRFGQFLGNVTGGMKGSGSLAYEKKKKAYAAGLYRALTGDTRLSDADAAARATPLLPDLADDEEFNKKVIDKTKKALIIREKLLRQGIGQTSLEEILRVAESSEANPLTGEFVIPSDKALSIGGLTIGGTYKGEKIVSIKEIK